MRFLIAFVAFLLFVPITLAGAVFGLFILWGDELPTPRRPQEVQPSQNTLLLDRHGELIVEFFVENRSPIPLVQVPEIMREAVLATEDRRFPKHWGVDAIGVARAIASNFAAGGITQGASTISQQLARNLFLTHSQTLERKLKEAVLAIRLERSFSKEEILELYLNQIYFGEGAYGVEAAALRFFGKSSRELSLAESALLAGLPANPAAYSPIRHPEAATRRRNTVLRRMETFGVIDAETRAAAENAPILLSSGRSAAAATAPYFAEWVRQQIVEAYGHDAVYGGGLVVRTTLDPRLQEAAEQSVEDALQEIEDRQAARYKRTEGVRVRGDESDTDSPETAYIQGALVAVEPQSGAVRAMVGGRDFTESRFNRAVQARRQPGSAFKPIVAAQALREGWQPNSVLQDDPITFRWAGQVWSPQNFDRIFRGPVSLQYTLIKSINVPSVRLIEEVGAADVVQLAREMGFSAPFAPHLSLALGTGEVTPLEITAAYGAFADHGILHLPYFIERVEDRHGNVLEEHMPESREIMNEVQSHLMVSMLQSVIDRGTGYPARGRYGLRAPAAGKTGTTDDYTDAWFVGFIPKLACGVWVGFDEKKKIGERMTGGVAALPAWAAFMKVAVEEYGEEPFQLPDGVVQRTTCIRTGMLPRPDCPSLITTSFAAGKAPRQLCSVHLGPAYDEEEHDGDPDAYMDEAPVSPAPIDEPPPEF